MYFFFVPKSEKFYWDNIYPMDFSLLTFMIVMKKL